MVSRLDFKSFIGICMESVRLIPFPFFQATLKWPNTQAGTFDQG